MSADRPPQGAQAPQRITSRDNPLLKELRQLGGDSRAHRKLGRIWLEGDHLCRAALDKGLVPEIAVFSESNWPQVSARFDDVAPKNVVIPDRLLAEASGLESAPPVGFVMALPVAPAAFDPLAASVVLDRLQDAGNVGSLLRSAAAFGFRQVLAAKGTAALWSPKVLRAGMGAHFGLALFEGLDVAALRTLRVPVVATSSHRGEWLHAGAPPSPCAWVFGHEGQGVSPDIEDMASHFVRIAQPGGEESLNVAAAGAICLHASATRELAAPPHRAKAAASDI